MSASTKHPILIVDDEPDVLFSLKGLLRHEFVLHTAESGEEALAILREHPIHVIMTDQRMPGMTGVELMQHAKKACPGAVRIVFTGYADIKAVVEAINTGGLYRYITKPWDPDELVEVLHEAAQRYDEDQARVGFGGDLNSFTTDVVKLIRSLPEDAASASAVSDLMEQADSISARATVLFSQ